MSNIQYFFIAIFAIIALVVILTYMSRKPKEPPPLSYVETMKKQIEESKFKLLGALNTAEAFELEGVHERERIKTLEKRIQRLQHDIEA